MTDSTLNAMARLGGQYMQGAPAHTKPVDEKCSTCDGDGEIPCDECNGTGMDADDLDYCEECDGACHVTCDECG